MKNITRRSFSRLALWSVPSAPVLFAQQTIAPTLARRDTLPLEIEISGIPQQVLRKALHQSEVQIATLRAYNLKRDTPPALILGVFDSPEMFALEGIKNVG